LNLSVLDGQGGDIDGAAIGVDEFQAQGVRAGSGREGSVNGGTRFGGDMAFAGGEELLASQRLPAAGEFGKVGEGVAVLEREAVWSDGSESAQCRDAHQRCESRPYRAEMGRFQGGKAVLDLGLAALDPPGRREGGVGD